MTLIAAAQMQMSADMDENYEKAIAFLKDAASAGAKFICYPEVQLTHFFAQYEGRDATDCEVTLDSKYVKGFQDACRENKIVASPNFYLREGGKSYDANLMIDNDGSLLGISKMVHVAQAKNFYEQDYYTPSEDGFIVFDTAIGMIGVVICFDRHYPESVRTCAVKGADLVVIPTANLKTEPMELFAWEVKVPAFQNKMNIIMCNRVGVEDEMHFAGESIVVGTEGETLAMADDKEQLLICDVDFERAKEKRATHPYVTLRNNDFYL